MQTTIIVDQEKYLISCAVSLWDQSARAAQAKLGRFVAALSGGQTPMALYRQLAKRIKPQIWDKTHIFQVDERHVPQDHPDSNLAMIGECLLKTISIPEKNVHGIRYALTLEETVDNFRADLDRFFEKTVVFDLILLGIGEDGHTASLFPETKVLQEKKAKVAGVNLAGEKHDRITLTFPVLNSAQRVVFLAVGENKAQAIREVFTEDPPPPAGRVTAPEMIFLLDPAAALLLPPQILNRHQPTSA